MIAAGCLLLVILPIVGLVVGGLIAGPEGAKWAAITGFAVALALCGTAIHALIRAGRRD